MSSSTRSLRRLGTAIALTGSAGIAALALGAPPASALTPPSTEIVFECNAQGQAVGTFTIQSFDQEVHQNAVVRHFGGPTSTTPYTLTPNDSKASDSYVIKSGGFLSLTILDQGSPIDGGTLMEADTSEPDCWKPHVPKQEIQAPTFDYKVDCLGTHVQVTLFAHAHDDWMHPLESHLTQDSPPEPTTNDDLTVGPGQDTTAMIYDLVPPVTAHLTVEGNGIDWTSGPLDFADGDTGCDLVDQPPVEEPPVEEPTADPTVVDEPTTAPASEVEAEVEVEAAQETAVAPTAAPELPRTGTSTAPTAALGSLVFGIGMVVKRIARARVARFNQPQP